MGFQFFYAENKSRIFLSWLSAEISLQDVRKLFCLGGSRPLNHPAILPISLAMVSKPWKYSLQQLFINIFTSWEFLGALLDLACYFLIGQFRDVPS